MNLLTVQETCKRLGVSRRTLYRRYIDTGVLVRIRRGRKCVRFLDFKVEEVIEREAIRAGAIDECG